MDKKTAELEALKKSKENQNAAGKVSGMSGRDLWDYRPEYFAEEDDIEASGGDSNDGGEWDLDKLRKETEEAQEREEETRLEELRKEFESVDVAS